MTSGSPPLQALRARTAGTVTIAALLPRPAPPRLPAMDRSVTCRPMERVCESCAREDDDLAVVHRLDVVPEDCDTPGSITRVEETELWCFSCRTMYPHEPLDES